MARRVKLDHEASQEVQVHQVCEASEVLLDHKDQADPQGQLDPTVSVVSQDSEVNRDPEASLDLRDLKAALDLQDQLAREVNRDRQESQVNLDQQVPLDKVAAQAHEVNLMFINITC